MHESANTGLVTGLSEVRCPHNISGIEFIPMSPAFIIIPEISRRVKNRVETWQPIDKFLRIIDVAHYNFHT